MGVRILRNTPVEEMVFEGRKVVTGVRTADESGKTGETIGADAVVVNADFAQAMKKHGSESSADAVDG